MPYKNPADKAAWEALNRRRAVAAPKDLADAGSRRLRHLEEEIRQLRRTLKAETKRADHAENLRESVFELLETDLAPPVWAKLAGTFSVLLWASVVIAAKWISF